MKTIFNLIMLLVFLQATSTHAAVMLSGGLMHKHTVVPGGKVSGVLELRNTDSKPVELKIYQEDIKINGAGKTEYVQTINRSTHNRSNASWINLGVDRIVLGPQEKRSVAYSIDVPNGQVNGSYWSSIMLEPVSDTSKESQLTAVQKRDQPTLVINQKMRYSVQVLTHIGGNRIGKSIFKFLSPNINKGDNGKRTLQFQIQNTGNRYSYPKVWLDVFTRSGEKIKRISAESHGLYTNEKEAFNIDLSVLSPGAYKALLAAEDNDTGQVFGSDINLTIKP